MIPPIKGLDKLKSIITLNVRMVIMKEYSRWRIMSINISIIDFP